MKWKMQCSLALLATFLAILSDSALAQRERQRSPIRSIPVGADVKRDTTFSCPEEFGYYPHPSDCSQYYVCVFGGALLESCTGGLMYSNELQTCDWPRNVGCSAGVQAEPEEPPSPSVAPSPSPRAPPPQRVRVQAPPQPPRPSPNPVVTSRGQPTYVNQHQIQDIVKQQLYAEVDEQLPPAEELENESPQRVLRGQPSSIGQVARDRDGQGRALGITPNTIQSGKIGSFSFGTQVEQQHQNYRVEPTVNSSPSYTQQTRAQQASGGRALYNGSLQYDPQQFEPYYALYDDDAELYKDDYAQQYNSAAQRPSVHQTYRGTPPPRVASPPSTTPAPLYTPTSNVYSSQPSADDYDDALINSQIDDHNQYQQPIRPSTTSALDDRNELGYELSTLGLVRISSPIPRILSTTRATTTTTTTTLPPPPPRAPVHRTSTRGRGSSHYSTANGAEQNTVNSNRGTPPPRARPTLKPSTSIVSKATEFVDIYRHPPRRPDTVYPTPQVDKTAAKCRKDVCLLPDCSCGGKDIPGDLPVEEVPQIVILTFDDSVNDLNKGLYSDLFEKDRVNPNGCPIAATFYVSHEWTDYSQVQNLYSAGHEMASHTVSHSFGEQFSQKKWNREISGQREILAAYGGVKLEDVRGMRAPFLSVGGNKMFKMLYDSNFTYDSSMPVYENRPPSWPYTLDYKLFHDCMIPPCPTKSYPGVWEVPMVMWQDLNGGRCSMGDACSNPSDADGVYKMLLKNFDRHYTTNRAPFGLFYHAAWFTQAHHKQGFIMFLDAINAMKDVFLVTNWQALQWVRDPTPLSRINSFQPFQCNYQDRPKRCNNPKVCNLWHKSGVRYMRTCQPCPEIYPWTGKTGIRSSRIDNDIED